MDIGVIEEIGGIGGIGGMIAGVTNGPGDIIPNHLWCIHRRTITSRRWFMDLVSASTRQA